MVKVTVLVREVGRPPPNLSDNYVFPPLRLVFGSLNGNVTSNCGDLRQVEIERKIRL